MRSLKSHPVRNRLRVGELVRVTVGVPNDVGENKHTFIGRIDFTRRRLLALNPYAKKAQMKRESLGKVWSG